MIKKIEVKEVKKKYSRKGTEILKNISFSANSGECVGILGLNGCGKTTLLSCLAGLVIPDSGSFFADNTNLFEVRHPESIIGYVPQSNPLMEDLTVRDNLRLWYTGAKLDMEEELNHGILKLLGIHEFIDKKVSNLSGGMKKRLSIGCSMANEPSILLLDEPSASLDIDCKEIIASYIKSFTAKGGIVLLATHEEGEIALCDRINILTDGTLHPYEYENIHTLTKDLKERKNG
ncbi:MAG: heme ABC exporter ATP-binding protein CcmA [Eubacterium sp.]|nr:heme ABC exporter ATP-binding protein CcmA [Eubacterium sp.]